jgi:hypothetical protein
MESNNLARKRKIISYWHLQFSEKIAGLKIEEKISAEHGVIGCRLA